MSSSGPLCICGETLIKKRADTCYNSSGVECDKCGSSVHGSKFVYHCKFKNSDIHQYGFDLCQQCGDELESTQNISKEFESNFLIIPDELNLYSRFRAFRFQKLCYFVNGKDKDYIDPKNNNFSSFKCDSITNYLQSDEGKGVKNEYFTFNNKSIYNDNDDDDDDNGNNNNDEYETNINFNKRQSSITSFPALIAEIKDNSFKYHDEFKKAMNLYSESDTDILNVKMSENNNKWKVVGLIDPDKHLSTLDHSLNDELNQSKNNKIDIMNYHHWIPSVFQINTDLTECQLLSEIPNLNPYKYSKTLYKLIEQLFLYQIPQFENVTNCNLRNIPLRVIVKAQDYQLFDCKEDNYYLGNMHKEGLYEDIIAVSLYYYQIDKDINGGDLEISSVIKVKDNDNVTGITELRNTKIKLKETTSLVFSNKLCYHRVTKLNGNGSRKIFAFFLISPYIYVNIPIDARFVVVNWKYHSKCIVLNWLNSLNQQQEEENNANNGYEWMLNIIYEYVVGDKKYIKKAIDLYNKCRKAYHHEITYSEYQITSSGKRKYVQRRRHHCNRD